MRERAKERVRQRQICLLLGKANSRLGTKKTGDGRMEREHLERERETSKFINK